MFTPCLSKLQTSAAEEQQFTQGFQFLDKTHTHTLIHTQ